MPGLLDISSAVSYTHLDVYKRQDLNKYGPVRDLKWEEVAPKRPLFFATLPPDISFFGFSFNVATARGDGDDKGMLFVIEQSPGLPRHGLDDNSTARGARDANSAWSDFSLQSQFGAYLDSVITKDAVSYTHLVRKYVASFVGFAPVSNPRLVVAIMIDEPGSGQHYGGDVRYPARPS